MPNNTNPQANPNANKLLNAIGKSMMMTAGVLAVVYGANAFMRHKGYNVFNQPKQACTAQAPYAPGVTPAPYAPRVICSSQPRKGPYALYSDDTIRFVDKSIELKVEDLETGEKAMGQMDAAVSIAPRECTWRDKARFARLGLGYEVIKDGYISRVEMGLEPKPVVQAEAPKRGKCTIHRTRGD
jgi:hypothetical protein